MINQTNNDKSNYCEAKVQLLNKVGLHARPAAMFVKAAINCKSDINVEKDGREVDAKSIFGILSLGVDQFDFVKIKAQGIDAKVAVDNLITLVKNKFGEE
jgi:phosphocarrier protein